jgi:hypothetical protein
LIWQDGILTNQSRASEAGRNLGTKRKKNPRADKEERLEREEGRCHAALLYLEPCNRREGKKASGSAIVPFEQREVLVKTVPT